MQFNQSKSSSFVEGMAKNYIENNDHHHKIHWILFLITWFTPIKALIWQMVRSSEMAQAIAYRIGTKCK